MSYDLLGQSHDPRRIYLAKITTKNSYRYLQSVVVSHPVAKLFQQPQIIAYFVIWIFYQISSRIYVNYQENSKVSVYLVI